MDPAAPPPEGNRAFAWTVHAFSASGALLAFLALSALLDGQWGMALFWLLVALVVDGVDGSLARAAHVKTLAPRIDGETLDLIIDYLNYVFVPTMLIVEAGLVPREGAPLFAGLILISALYNFTRRDLKTEDNYFRGFPALWNVAALYLFLGQPGVWVGAGVVILFAALTFAPVHFIHPFRVRDFGRWPPLLAALWAAATAALLWPWWSDGFRLAWFSLSLGSAAVLLALGFVRTARGAA